MDRYFGWLRRQIGSMEDTYTIQSCIRGYHSIRKFRCRPGTSAFRSCAIFSVCNFFLERAALLLVKQLTQGNILLTSHKVALKLVPCKLKLLSKTQYSVDLSQGGLEVSTL